MKWSIHQLQKYRNKGLTFDEMVDVSELKEENTDIREISPVHLQGRADFTSDYITFHLHITGTMVLPCSRSLVDVPLPFDVHTKEVFLLEHTEYEGDEDFRYLEGEVLDLLPVIKENIILEIPLQVFSEEAEPAGGAPTKGQDWQVISEKDQAEKIDPRLAGLAKFFDK
ncbi:DUF177 domain-containing protein [Bacillus sp. 165]|uniref:YceD family protein n=1 Tax=Bacillus sp. 165 TaxID=1529117 RepID=UPI001ADD5136|nr:DUF177 domain-containing protein [Bacillus sp. 165]MBO9130278.1 DUF177 domain-containing protein [Bacillus sp. 165]